jgi:hypothetical protein
MLTPHPPPNRPDLWDGCQDGLKSGVPSRVPRYRSELADPPGRVAALRGIIFQNDGQSAIGRFFIRPLEAIDRWLAGVRPSRERPPLAMHAGLHVSLADGREVVAEQLVGTLYMDFRSGLNWTPIEKFRERDRGGWDLTLPATAFRGVDAAVVDQTVQRLNSIEGHPFVGEDCTAFIERAFGGRRMFADSPLLRALGFSVRVGDPALPLLRPDADLDERARRLLHAEAVKQLPDAEADPDSLNARLWLRRAAVAAPLGWAIGHALAAGYSSGSRRSMPASSTARRFFK